MKKRIAGLFAAVMFLGFASASWAGAAVGDAAYSRGDYTTAFREFLTAAEQGNAGAQASLGGMYLRGRGVAQNDKLGAYWVHKAAEQGVALAQLVVGQLHKKGRGLPKDYQIALTWFRKAADQGLAQAYVNLGLMHEEGLGVAQDDQQAALWFFKAAESGDADGQVTIGHMYRYGKGVPRDTQQAYFWYLLASAQSNELGEKGRTEVALLLTPQQRGSAQSAASGWKPQTSASARASQVAPTSPAPSREGLNDPSSTGSGFYVSGARIITNHHVVDGCRRLQVGSAIATVLASDARIDLAVMTLQAAGTSTATVRVGRISVGETAIVAGFPLSGLLAGLNVTAGNVSSLRGIRGDTRLLQITAPVQPGNSGGPLLDASGNIMGVVVSKLNALKVADATGDIPQNVNFAVNANVLASFLDSTGVDYKTGGIGASLSTQEIARRAQAFTVLVECWK